jgi:protease I
VFAADKPVAAICHGVVLVARSLGADGQSVLHGRQSTALLQSQELLAWSLTRLWLGDYYRTYPQTVQSEVTEALAAPTDFLAGPFPLRRDSPANLSHGFALRDGNYLSARWPGDAHRFASDFCAMLAAHH